MEKPKSALRIYRQAGKEAKKRLLPHLEPRIALNYARVLSIQGSERRALRALEKFRGRFSVLVDAFQYFGTLADLYARAGKPERAIEAWRIAKSRAMGVGDSEYASYCASQEARLQARLGRTDASLASISNALNSERDIKRRANLLIQRFEILATQKSSKSAQKSFDEALRLCKENGLHEQSAELYLSAGDHSVKGNYESKLNAFKAYVMAIVSAGQVDLARSGEVMFQIILKLGGPDSRLTVSEVTRLRGDLGRYLVSQVPDRGKAVRFMLWPFELAGQLLPLRRKRSRFLRAIKRIANQKNIRGTSGLRVPRRKPKRRGRGKATCGELKVPRTMPPQLGKCGTVLGSSLVCSVTFRSFRRISVEVPVAGHTLDPDAACRFPPASHRPGV